MPPVEDDLLIDKAVYWPFAGSDDFGNIQVGAPVEIDCRWVEKRGQTVDAKGLPVAFDATLTLDRPAEIGSNMWKGELADFNDATNADIMQVNSTSETPDVDGRFTVYGCTLKRFRDNLPTPEE